MSDADMTFVARGDKDVWRSPGDLLAPILRHVDVHVDPCAGAGDYPTRLGSHKNIAPPRNGLAESWDVPGVSAVTAYVNPPFTQKAEWLAEAVERYERGEVARVFVVTPDSTDVISWWHEYIADSFRWSWFPEGRVDYIDPDPEDGDTPEQANGVSFGTAVSVLGHIGPALRRELAARGDLVRREVEP
ncbi:putative Dam methylase [Halorubrum phage Hardycor1]|nr:putative Dam methylase [Halorubrum phage Hardycor1]